MVDPASVDFANNYIATGEFDVDIALNPTKSLTGRTVQDEEFTFALMRGDMVLETVQSEPDGNIPFSKLHYTQLDRNQTYTYTIREVIPSPRETGMAYDRMLLTFKVSITDRNDGTLEAALIDSIPVDTEFNNHYTASGAYDVDLDLNPTKTLTGRELKNGDFEFQLMLGSAVLQTIKNRADGNIPFTKLTYTQEDISKTFDYTIHEVIPAIPEDRMTYDTKIISFSVIVLDEGNGVLTTVATKPVDAVFQNKKQPNPGPGYEMGYIVCNIADCFE